MSIIRSFLSNIWRNYKNIPGWSTNRKILVIEGDDYGSLRMPSLEAYDFLKKNKLINDGIHDKYDSIENEEDLKLMFDILKSYKDIKGNFAKFTPFFNTTNPDTENIINNNFDRYYYLNYYDTLKKLGISGIEIKKLWEEGIKTNIFTPQYHGMEHVNVPILKKLLNANNTDLKKSLSVGFFHPKLDSKSQYQSLRAAFFFDNELEKEELKSRIEEGIHIFKEYFNYTPTVFCPSNGVFHDDFKPTLYKNGIKTIVESGVRYYPDGKGGSTAIRKYKFGEFSKTTKLINYSRNVTFEPTRDGIPKSVSKAIDEVTTAFRWNKPVVIATHRTNFSGNLHPENRERGLEALNKLLSSVVKLWPNVEFMHSGELSELVYSSINKNCEKENSANIV